MASFVQMIAGSAVGCAAPRMTTEAQRATTASLEDAKEASRAPRSSGIIPSVARAPRPRRLAQIDAGTAAFSLRTDSLVVPERPSRA